MDRSWTWTWTKLPLSVLFLVCVSSLLSLQNKLKKIKEKYKDQDEEDRELRMQLLGVRRLSLCVTAASRHLQSFQSHLRLIRILTLWMLYFFSQLVPPRKRRIRGRKERRGRGKTNPPGNRPLRNHLRNLATWRRQRRNPSKREERRILRRDCLEKRQLLLTRRKRC